MTTIEYLDVGQDRKSRSRREHVFEAIGVGGALLAAVGLYAMFTAPKSTNKVVRPVFEQTLIDDDGALLGPLPLRLEKGDLVEVNDPSTPEGRYSCSLGRPGKPDQLLSQDFSLDTSKLDAAHPRHFTVATAKELQFGNSFVTASLVCASIATKNTTTLIFQIIPPLPRTLVF